ncbi:hypothetical protein FOXYS1_11732 [Fusarium oxysporum]|uniref:Amidase domain-containing protein n=1 Tax=Fusarium oxysporum TaxID=5507 RepID=A0A8H5A2I1_FUSOX|nr:hypothetical protein FOXYS1_11732 [Fusarium oxysporum]
MTVNSKLTIGVLYDDGVVKPHPSIVRVIAQAAAALAADGHELVMWKPDLHAECIEVMDAYFTVDGGEDIRRDVEAGGEPFIPSVERLVNRGKPISVFDYWQLNKRKRELQQAYLEKWNNTLSKKGKTVDAIIMPALPHVAVPHNTVKWVGYTKVWNLLDYTALVIPGGKVEAKDLDALWDHEPRNELDEWNTRLWEDNMQEMAKHHLPVDIQIVGRVLEEEKVLAVGKNNEIAGTNKFKVVASKFKPWHTPGVSCTFIYDQNKAVKMIFTISWTNEGDDFIFQNEPDAKFWERVVRLCRTVLPLQKCIITELEGTVFREMLEISDQDWSETWRAAVLAPMPENTPQNQPYVSTTTVVQEGARIRRSVARFGSRFGIRVRFPRFSRKKKKKGQNEEVANEATPAA